MTRRAEFTGTTKLAAWQRAGGPDNPRCECGKLKGRRPICFGMPITKSDPAEYHHIEEAESEDSPERRAHLKSLENCLCVRRSCHKWITKAVTMPKIVKSRLQRMREANIKTRSGPPMPGSRDSEWKHMVNKGWVKR